MQLRDLTPSARDEERVLIGTISALNSDGSLGVDFGGGRISDPIPALDSGWTPAEGLPVVCMRMDTSWVALGPLRGSNPTAAVVQTSLAFPFNVLGTAPASASPLVVSASGTGSWRPRDPGGWMQSDVYQGAYSTAHGFYRGCYFYGSGAFDSLEGMTCTALTIHLSRESAGGANAEEPVYLAPHTHPTQPSTQPYFPVAARKYTGPAWSATKDIALPKEWGQGLIDGTYAGIGHLYSGTGDYAIFKSVADDATTGRLTLSFS